MFNESNKQPIVHVLHVSGRCCFVTHLTFTYLIENIKFTKERLVYDIAIFVLKRDIKLQLTNYKKVAKIQHFLVS